MKSVILSGTGAGLHHNIHVPWIPQYSHGHAPVPHLSPVRILHRPPPSRRDHRLVFHIREYSRLVCRAQQTRIQPAGLGICPGMDRALPPHGVRPLFSPQRRNRKAPCPAGRPPLSRPACPQLHLVDRVLRPARRSRSACGPPAPHRHYRDDRARLPAHLGAGRMAVCPLPCVVLFCCSTQCPNLDAQRIYGMKCGPPGQTIRYTKTVERQIIWHQGTGKPNLTLKKRNNYKVM